ncbi:tRNA (adenosine(37)-N6)-threonylcarbamoyltransferase complex transferase subunit TsaD, partial [candidate division KSB1 bacterium]|nr:tRNA (adenosine(37)-N6)-threonylcarbamoyltransferase complex transferase subunit TsaD [candidate division KSB1 bacterium]
RAMLSNDNFDFSFSGLKTAVLYYLKRHSNEEIEEHRNDILASFQAALVDVLVEKTIRAGIKKGVKKVVLAGGVACNSSLRRTMNQRAMDNKMKLYFPPPVLCTDNAAMIACAGRYRLLNGENSAYNLSPLPSLKL